MNASKLDEDLGKLGHWLDDHELDRAVLTTSVSQRDTMLGWVAVLEGKGVEMLIVPGALDYMVGAVKSSNLFGVPLVNLSNSGLHHGMKVAKRLMDLVGSACALVLLFPVLTWVAWRIRMDSEGPVLYRQKRLGLHGKPFSILKFRTMVQNTEGATPQLSSNEDPASPELGKVATSDQTRRIASILECAYGDMSLVGPRPDRPILPSKLCDRALTSSSPTGSTWNYLLGSSEVRLRRKRQ